VKQIRKRALFEGGQTLKNGEGDGGLGRFGTDGSALMKNNLQVTSAM
jgi:hypothetical protein